MMIHTYDSWKSGKTLKSLQFRDIFYPCSIAPPNDVYDLN